MSYLQLNSFSIENHNTREMFHKISQRLCKLSQLMVNEKTCAKYRDERIDNKNWKKVVARELYYLNNWLRFRNKFPSKHAATSNIERALLLLPSNAISMHILRRVIPFMALGVKVDVGFHPNTLTHGESILFDTVDCLNINNYLDYKNVSAIEKLTQFPVSNHALVCCTGKDETLSLIRKTYSGELIGCAGSCSVLLCDEINHAERIGNLLSQHNYAHSCTSLKYKCVKSLYDDTIFVAESGSRNYKPQKIKDFLYRVHPSVILRHGGITNARINNYFNYRSIECDSNGHIHSQIGFACDPKYGWPGDYLL